MPLTELDQPQNLSRGRSNSTSEGRKRLLWDEIIHRSCDAGSLKAIHLISLLLWLRASQYFALTSFFEILRAKRRTTYDRKTYHLADTDYQYPMDARAKLLHMHGNNTGDQTSQQIRRGQTWQAGRTFHWDS